MKGYDSMEGLFKALAADLLKNEDKEYFYIYIHEIDSMAHEKGTQSEEVKAVIESLFKSLDEFYEDGRGRFHNTAVLISADHGQLDIDLEKVCYINKLIPDIEKYLKKNKNNEVMAPAGYCRDLFLHVEEKYLIELKAIIEKELEEIAQVYLFDELKDTGIFEVTFPGMHGGTSKQEMEIPFLFYRFMK